jgi:hypothetical protein
MAQAAASQNSGEDDGIVRTCPRRRQNGSSFTGIDAVAASQGDNIELKIAFRANANFA